MHKPAAPPLLEARNVKKYFPIQRGVFGRTGGHVRAVDEVSLEIHHGETLGLVGESGCGKSTLGRVLLMLQHPTAGEVRFEGRDLLALKKRELRAMRREMQIIFQDPFGSLDPRYTIGDIVAEPLEVHRIASGREKEDRVVELLTLVGLDPARRHRFPHEFSGGQRQRVSIARSIALHPKLIVADEPVSALDVSVQSQVINLLSDLQDRLGLTYLFIAHGLNVVRHISDRIGVMYMGKLVEVALTNALFSAPFHHYTAALLAAIPVPDPHRRRTGMILQGDVPSPANPPSGCRFRTRCALVQARCAEEEPPLKEIAPGRQVACHFPLS
jgi:oligopeptide/dipeptide ABC transporter ATP-binding protein